MRWMLGCVLAVALVGCDSPGGNGGELTDPNGGFKPGTEPTMKPGTGAGSYAVTEVCPLFAKMFCFEQVACDLGESTIPQECMTTFQALCQVHITRAIGEAIAAGEATYDGAAAARCFNGMTVTCDGTTNPNQADCDQILVGKIAAGQPCDYAASCEPGSRCEPGEGGTCPGTCVPDAKEGEACGWDEGDKQCASGLDCNGEVCEKELNDQPIGGECQYSDQCVAGAWCDYMENTCKARVAAGEVCSNGDACLDGLYCDFGGEAATCKTALGEGEVCGASSGACKGSLYCDCPADKPECTTEERVCLDDSVKPGDPCQEDGVFGPCGWGDLYCRTSDNTCQPPPKVGQPCGEAVGVSECLWGWCNPTSNTCEAFALENQACTTQAQCLMGLACIEGKCTAPPVTCTSNLGEL